MNKRNPLYVLSLICVFLLFLPKVNILTFQDETAGLRIDDFILLFFSFVLGCSFYLNNKAFNRLEIWLFFIVTLSLVSFLSNRMLVTYGDLQVKAKIFYVFRIFEYFLFFYVGRIAATMFNLDKIIRWFLYVNVVMMFLQKLGFVGKITEFGSQTIDTSRVSGMASFPAEMGGLLNMIFCYLLLNKPNHKGLFNIKLPDNIEKFWEKTRDYRLLLIFMVLTALTGARIAIAATLFIFFLYLVKVNRRHSYRLLFVLSFISLTIAPIIYFIIMNSDGIISRSLDLLSWKNLDIVATTWNQINTNIELNENVTLTPGKYDMSWWMRIHKWCYALKIYLTNPECYLQGIGPGAFTAALDGGFLRILTETGLLGCFLYWGFFKYIYRQSQTLKWIIISFLLNMIFFDVYLAYKTMSFLFFISGNYYSLRMREASKIKSGEFIQKNKRQLVGAV